MEFKIPIGVKHHLEIDVKEINSARTFGSGMVDVYATPAMIALLERTAMLSESEKALQKAHDELENKTGKGSEYTGWLDLPSRIEDSFLDELTELGQEIRENSDCLLSIGIGGSYVGIHASLEFLISEQKIPVHYAGHNLSSGYLYHLLDQLKDQRVTVVVI